jgi:signal transduction histidine kinase
VSQFDVGGTRPADALVPLPEPGDPFAGAALSKLGHELRGPLAGIISLSSIMVRKLPQQTGDPAQQARQLQLINGSAAELLETVERVVALAHAAGSPVGRPEPIDCHIIAAKAVAELAAAAQVRGRRVVVAAPDGPVLGVGHIEDAHRIVIELLDNAIKYTDHDEVGVTVRRGSAGRGPSIEIHDDGPGLAPQERQQVFLPFERGSAAHNRHESGVGLGLPLAQRLARRGAAELTVRTSAAGTACAISFEPLATS